MGHPMAFTRADTWNGMGKAMGRACPMAARDMPTRNTSGPMVLPMGAMASRSWQTMGSFGPAYGRVMGRDGERRETTRVGRHDAMAFGRASMEATAAAGGMAWLAGRHPLQPTTPVRRRR